MYFAVVRLQTASDTFKLIFTLMAILLRRVSECNAVFFSSLLPRDKSRRRQIFYRPVFEITRRFINEWDIVYNPPCPRRFGREKNCTRRAVRRDPPRQRRRRDRKRRAVVVFSVRVHETGALRAIASF